MNVQKSCFLVPILFTVHFWINKERTRLTLATTSDNRRGGTGNSAEKAFTSTIALLHGKYFRDSSRKFFNISCIRVDKVAGKVTYITAPNPEAGPLIFIALKCSIYKLYCLLQLERVKTEQSLRDTAATCCLCKQQWRFWHEGLLPQDILETAFPLFHPHVATVSTANPPLYTFWQPAACLNRAALLVFHPGKQSLHCLLQFTTSSQLWKERHHFNTGLNLSQWDHLLLWFKLF